MPGQDLEAPLLFPLECFLVGKELLERDFVVGVVVRDLDVLPDDPHAIIPSIAFVAVVDGRFRRDLQGVARLDLFFEEGVMVLLEQSNELIGKSPFDPVVIFDRERFFFCLRPGGWALGLNGWGLPKTERQTDCCTRLDRSLRQIAPEIHDISFVFSVMMPLYPALYLRNLSILIKRLSETTAVPGRWL